MSDNQDQLEVLRQELELEKAEREKARLELERAREQLKLPGLKDKFIKAGGKEDGFKAFYRLNKEHLSGEEVDMDKLRNEENEIFFNSLEFSTSKVVNEGGKDEEVVEHNFIGGTVYQRK